MQSVLNKTLPWLWAAVWFTIPISFRANTLSLLLFGLASVMIAYFEKPKISRYQWITISLFAAFFLWHATSFLFDPLKFEVWKSLERKISFITIPIIVTIFDSTKIDAEKWAIRGFFAGLIVTGFHMIFNSIVQIISGLDIGKWTYHEFTNPYHIGAIYYSWYLSIAIIYLAFIKPQNGQNKFQYILLLFFLALLFFSASKLFIILTIPVVLFKFFKNWKLYKSKSKYLFLGLIISLLAMGAVPISKRFSEVINPNLEVVKQTEFSYDTPFNGISIRLLQWRFAYQILKDHKAWLCGVGIGSRQEILNEYYIKYNVYHGNPELGDTGYLDYNFHNQYVEVLVGTGFIGLIILFIIIINIFVKFNHGLIFPFIVYLFVLLFFVTESVLERQAGIVLFCLLWALPITTNKTGKTYGSSVSTPD